MIPFGKAKVVREGSDLTVVTAGALVKRSLDAAKLASEDHGIETEVIDLRTLSPFDMDTIAVSVKKTNKVLVAHEDSLSWGVGSEIAARIADELFPWLDGPVRRIGSLDTWVAYAPQLENAILPQMADVLEGILERVEGLDLDHLHLGIDGVGVGEVVGRGVVAVAERSVELIRDFARAGLSGAGGGPFDAPAPAFATARSGRAPIRLLWSGDGGLEVECEIRRATRGATLTGRVTAGGGPARATSVTLVTPGETWGPESPDPGGRFGPWPLAAGRNRLVLAGGTEDDGAVELSIEVEADDSRATGGEDRPGQTRGPSDGR